MASSSLSSLLHPNLFTISILLFILSPLHVNCRLLRLNKPKPSDAAATARWLAAQNSWGVLRLYFIVNFMIIVKTKKVLSQFILPTSFILLFSTISSDLGGAPFGNVVSYSDGLPSNGKGIPYFYLTTLDPTARDALKDQRASFTISEFPIGTCGKVDPENPTCAKLTLTGKLVVVEGNSVEAEFAQRALFSKHPEMEDWPENHDFRIFKLNIENLFLIDWFGGPKPLSPEKYISHQMNQISLLSSF